MSRFPGVLPLDSIKAVIADVEGGRFSLNTVEECLYAAGCLVSMIPGGLPTMISGSAADCPDNSALTIDGCCQALKTAIEPIDVPAGINASQFNPLMLIPIIEWLLRLSTMFAANQPAVTAS